MDIVELKRMADNAAADCPGQWKQVQSGKRIVVHQNECCRDRQRPFEKAANPRVVAALCDIAEAAREWRRPLVGNDVQTSKRIDEALAALDEAMR